jgi:hypothetical protein
MLLYCVAYSSTLKMEMTCSSETSVEFYRTTLRWFTEDGTFHNHRCENLKSYNVDFVLLSSSSFTSFSSSPSSSFHFPFLHTFSPPFLLFILFFYFICCFPPSPFFYTLFSSLSSSPLPLPKNNVCWSLPRTGAKQILGIKRNF